MSKENFTEIICVIDRSGSMASIKDDAIGGFNTFLEDQKKLPGNATLTYAQFDTEYEIVYENKPLQEVPLLDDKTFVPRGATALLDAVGRTINSVGQRLDKMNKDSKPSKIVVAILTDGEENSSREFKKDQIKQLVEQQRSKYSWEFIFLAANQDAFAEGISLGMKGADTISFAATGNGIKKAYKGMTQTVASYRTK